MESVRRLAGEVDGAAALPRVRMYQVARAPCGYAKCYEAWGMMRPIALTVGGLPRGSHETGARRGVVRRSRVFRSDTFAVAQTKAAARVVSDG